MRKIILSFFFVSLLGLVFVGLAGAQTATFVNHVSPDFRQYYSAEERLGQYYPIFSQEDEFCRNRQDIILQVAPAGCQPTVVRSDLLAEQNVPVFCQLQAIQANPLVDIKQIRNIRFSGRYPAEISGTGFHPAKAALRTGNVLLGNPVLNDVGYVVVVLKKNPNEKELPDFVNATLTANLDYYAGNAFGIGSSELLLQVVDDSKWNSVRNKQSFLNGEYFFRLEDAEPEFAIVSVYHQDRKINTVRISRAEASEKIYLPGLYCGGELRLKYDGFVSPENIARLKVGDDEIEVYEGSSFLNNKCVVRDIRFTSNSEGSVDVVCGTERFSLSINPERLNTGDLVKFADKAESAELWSVVGFEENSDGKKIRITNLAGTESRTISYSEIVPADEGRLYEAVYNAGIEDYIKQSIDSYERTAVDYSAEKDNSGFYGERALEKGIEFADNTNKEVTEARLINLLLEQYPSANNFSKYSDKLNRMYSINSDKAVAVVDIDNDYKTIKLIGFRAPEKKSTATIAWGGERFSVEQGNSTSVSLGNLTLNRIERTGISISVKCLDKDLSGGNFNVKVDETQRGVCGRDLSIVNLNIEDFARIKVEPATRTTGQTNISINIGIEKRAIQLSPEKAREKIENLNKTIEKWESVSNSLGNVVTGLKAACFATSGILTAKNFLTGLSGEALARQKVMRDRGGWTDRCTNAVSRGEYSSMDECFRQNAGAISGDVKSMTEALNQVNDRIKGIQGDYVKPAGIFGETITVDTDGLKQTNLDYIKQTYGNSNIESTTSSNQQLVLGDVIGRLQSADSLSLDKMSDIELYAKLIDNQGISNEQKELYKQRLGFILEDVEKRNTADSERTSFETDTGFKAYIPSYSKSGEYYGNVYSSGKINLGSGVDIEANSPIQAVQGNDGAQYLFVLNELKNQDGQTIYSYDRNKIYKLTDNNGWTANALPATFDVDKSIGSFSTFRSLNAGSYNYAFAQGEAVVKYYEREPFKGMPAMVPVDVESGFYAATEQTLPGFGNIKAFESSGRIVGFYVCNVMEDKRVGFFSPGFGDDRCIRFDLTTGQPLDVFPGLDSSKAKRLVEKAIQALNEAARQYGKSQVTILGKVFQTGAPAASSPATQCQDFMSPEDCQLLFNVCDPVICPTSRCDFGGQYPVDNVIQSGIVGSALLCLPNAKEGIVVPVCLSGIKAGVDGYLSILKSHQACLQENIDTGNTVGVCDLITSVYACEFFWRQAAPLANVLLPKIVEFAYTGGQGQVRGGGEYLTVQSAWKNTQDSIDYFTNYYAKNSFDSFRARSIEEAGTPFCKAFVSAKSPTSFDTLLAPDSPAQYHAWFRETIYSDATVPSTSQYKLFYHIFAGNDRGAVFSVYLKEPPESSYYRTTPQIIVASGFVARGQAVSETKDFTAPSGYKQLCIRVNDQEECGFKQVSTSFAVDYLKDQFVKDELGRTDIKTEAECISGSVNPGALLNPNIQEAAQEAIDPAVYKRGIVRICSTENPGLSTDSARFKEVGFCGDEKLVCWLDTNSVDTALSDSIPADIKAGINNQTLSELGGEADKILQENGFVLNAEALLKIDKIVTEIDKLVGKGSELKNQQSLASDYSQKAVSIESDIEDLMRNLFFDRDKAALLIERGRLYEGLARILIGPDFKGDFKGLGKASHTECREQMCYSVEGPGDDECNVDEDCASITGNSNGGTGQEAAGTAEQSLSIKDGILHGKEGSFLYTDNVISPIYFVGTRVFVVLSDRAILIGDISEGKIVINSNQVSDAQERGFIDESVSALTSKIDGKDFDGFF